MSLNWVKSKILLFGQDLTLSKKKALVFMRQEYKSFENTVGKGEIAHIEQSPSVHIFYLFGELPACNFKSEIGICKLSVWRSLKICHLGKGLRKEPLPLSIQFSLSSQYKFKLH